MKSESFYLRQYLFPFLLSGVIVASATALLAMTVGTVSAQAKQTHYNDVPAGAWYEGSAAALLDAGALDDREASLRPGDLATRAEVMKMLVQAYDEPLIYPAIPSFDDVPRSAWYYPYFEAAAKAGLVKGDGNCYKRSRPCTARPADGVNRAEMAILLQRAYALTYEALAPVFPDNRASAWYFEPIQTAADHCVLQGDDRTGLVRPAAFMNRAEMVVMFHRASENLRYGEDCGEDIPPVASISSVAALTSTRVRLTFNTDMDTDLLNDAFRYTVRRSDGADFDVISATVITNRIVELSLNDSLSGNASYTVTATNVRTDAGLTFSDSISFVFGGEESRIESVTVRDLDLIRVRYSEDVDPNRANDVFRYHLERASGGGVIDIDRAIIIDDRTVDLELRAAMVNQTTYELSVENMLTDEGLEFDSSRTFVSSAVAPAGIDEVLVRTADLLRVRFTDNMNASRADDSFRYTLERASGGGEINIDRAVIVDDRTVDLDLSATMANQTSYILRVNDLLTDDGEEFDDSETFSSSQASSSVLDSATVVSSTRLRLEFNEDLDVARASDESRYSVTGFQSDLGIDTATLIDSNTVELILDDPMQVQEEYTASVFSLSTEDGDVFSDDVTFVQALSNVSFEATLSGLSEVPPVVTPAAGTGTFLLTSSGLQFDITLRNMSSGDITGAHFHIGDVGTEGPVLEAITFNGLRATGTWTGLTAAERDDILDGDIYVNIHTAANPDGEIRGQVERP